LSMAEFAAKLNRRHKVALCATLICMGLILLLGGGAPTAVGIRPALGIMLLGLAFSWALGSNNRLVHWLFIVFGLLLLLSLAFDGFLWRRAKAQIIKSQISVIDGDRWIIESERSGIESDRSLIQADRSAFAEDTKGNRDLSTDAEILGGLSDAYLVSPSSENLRDYGRKRRDLQEKIEKDSALNKDLAQSTKEMLKDEQALWDDRQTLRDDERKLQSDEREQQNLQAEGIFRHVLKTNWGTVVGGLLLLSAGLGLIVGVEPARQNQSEQPR
jgi:hypothetical protein